ncbi:MAG: sortase [Frankiaceae bacterium]|nr:sortase [Frankiaceae bacterium]
MRGGARRVLTAVGETLVTAGVIVLLFAAYELWGTGVYTSGQQNALHQQLEQQWATAAPTAVGPSPGSTATSAPTAVAGPSYDITKVPLGSGLAVLRIPRFGKDYDKVIVEGVGVEDLKRGPGHYPGSAFPGQIGNFVVSGHRTTYGAPFNRIDELRAGDPIVVETATNWYVYRVTSSEIVPPTATDVVTPVPHHIGQAATTALMTLTTCNPKYSAAQRLIVYAALDSTSPAANPPLDVLAKG